jgi:hypothetical protein
LNLNQLLFNRRGIHTQSPFCKEKKIKQGVLSSGTLNFLELFIPKVIKFFNGFLNSMQVSKGQSVVSSIGPSADTMSSDWLTELHWLHATHWSCYAPHWHGKKSPVRQLA